MFFHWPAAALTLMVYRMIESETQQLRQARVKLRAIPETGLSDSYIAVLPLSAVLELLAEYERGIWPPKPFALIL